MAKSHQYSGSLGHGRPLRSQARKGKEIQMPDSLVEHGSVSGRNLATHYFLLHYDVSIIQAQFRGALHKSLVAPKCKMFQGSADEEFENRVWQAAILPIVLKTRRLCIRSLFLAGTAFSTSEQNHAFQGSRASIFQCFFQSFPHSIPDIIFLVFLMILGSPRLPFWSSWA